MAVLTAGSILGIYRNEVTSGADGPLLQVIDIRPIKSGTGTSQQRYRLILSDGEAYQQAMLATQKNDLITDGKLKQNAIVRLSKFICNEVQNRHIVIVLDLDIVGGAQGKIGTPQSIDTVVASGGAGAAAPEGKDAGEGGGGGDAGRAPPGKHDLLADVQRWFTEPANPAFDADMLVALPLPPAATGVEDRQSRCAVVMCGNDDDEDIVQPRSCRANGCSYHRKCLDRQVRDGATARNH